MSRADVESGIEEDAEFLDADAEDFCKEEVAAFVQQHENHKTAEQLGGFNQEYFHWSRKGFRVILLYIYVWPALSDVLQVGTYEPAHLSVSVEIRL